MSSINHNRAPAVLFRLIIAAALLLFTTSFPKAHAQFGGFIPGLGALPLRPIISNLPLPPLIPTNIPLPNIPALPVSLPNIPALPNITIPLIPTNIPLPPVSLPSIPPLIPSVPVPPVSSVPPPPPIPSQLPAGLNVTGQFCCTPTGNCPVQGGGGQGVGGVPVILNCTFRSGTFTVGGGNTGVTGTFSIITFLPVVLDFLSTFFSTGGQIPCVAIIDQAALSPVFCPVISPLSGTLESSVTFIGTTTNGLAQTIVNANATGFFLVPV